MLVVSWRLASTLHVVERNLIGSGATEAIQLFPPLWITSCLASKLGKLPGGPLTDSRCSFSQKIS
ncbi:hypothetical protein IHE45_16G000400 [Dioscorea alata]|uniref:Uncharacterized protein n=1 Tax=Dioscorea alata TaxID=55571 RepID=A0ACB7UF31_DIOAL|nr:hypothetical protein IHE45_16G000400 [Dioscorea alata]